MYVSGNLLVFYEQGNRRRHISPDVFIVRGVPNHLLDNYLIWEEKKGPEIVVELTSSSTRHTDTKRKMALYQNVLKVKEYFLFDPYDDYLVPRFQGYRLRGNEYVPIRMSMGRISSEVLDLQLFPVMDELRLFDPKTGKQLPTPLEDLALKNEALRKSEIDRLRSEAALDRLEAENERLRRLLDHRGKNGGNGKSV